MRQHLERYSKPSEPQEKTYANLPTKKKTNAPTVEKRTPVTTATAASAVRNLTKETFEKRPRPMT